uniref:Uncharacterized protein n=1 Tax=Arundo donax TaxID=35708 RepID=A0A0A8XW19_ARUDO
MHNQSFKLPYKKSKTFEAPFTFHSMFKTIGWFTLIALGMGVCFKHLIKYKRMWDMITSGEEQIQIGIIKTVLGS